MGYTPEVPQDLVAPACGSPASAQGNETRQSPGRELQSCGPGASQLGEHCAGTWDLVPQCGPRILCRQAPSRASGNTWEKSVGCGECSGVLSRFPRWEKTSFFGDTAGSQSSAAPRGLWSLWETGWMGVTSPAGAATLTCIYGSQAPFPCSGQHRRAHLGWSTPWSR